jgi:hypothetical protein
MVTVMRTSGVMISVACHETAIFIVIPVRNWNLMISVACHETAIFIVTPVRNWNLMTSVTCHEAAIFIVTPVRNWNLMTSVTCHETTIFIVTPVRTSGTKEWRSWCIFINVTWHKYFYKPSFPFQTIKFLCSSKEYGIDFAYKEILRTQLNQNIHYSLQNSTSLDPAFMSFIHPVPSYPIPLRFIRPSI